MLSTTVVACPVYEEKKMGLGQRIKTARELLGWDQAKLSRESRVAQPTLSALETRDSDRSSYAEQLIAAFPDSINKEWLRTGRGEPKTSLRYVDGGLQPMPSSPTMQPILAWEHPDDLPPGEFVMIPRLELKLSAGHGNDQLQIDFIEQQPQAFRADWIRKKRLRPGRLASMTADGDSMEERIQDGDALVVDTSQVEVLDGKVYALWYEGGERVKRLYRLPGGGLRIHSDNPKYADILLRPDEVEHVRVIGRVVHIAGEGGL